MPVRAAVLVAFNENGVTARDQQAGGRVAREVVVQLTGNLPVQGPRGSSTIPPP
jgi:hypothetical protein